jgi:hypothetical protein
LHVRCRVLLGATMLNRIVNRVSSIVENDICMHLYED